MTQQLSWGSVHDSAVIWRICAWLSSYHEYLCLTQQLSWGSVPDWWPYATLIHYSVCRVKMHLRLWDATNIVAKRDGSNVVSPSLLRTRLCTIWILTCALVCFVLLRTREYGQAKRAPTSILLYWAQAVSHSQSTPICPYRLTHTHTR